MKYNVLFLAITIMISWNVFSFNPDELFVNGYYHQDEVLTPEEGIIINAKVDGEYQNFVLAAFPPSFMEWNIKKRKQAINDIVEHQPPHLHGQISLELYSERQFLTQTFLNQAFNPVSTIVYLDIPSYKFKAITQLLD